MYANRLLVSNLPKQFELIELRPSRALDQSETHFIVQSLRKKNEGIVFLNYIGKIFTLKISSEAVIGSFPTILLPKELGKLKLTSHEEMILDLFETEKESLVYYFLGELLATHLRSNNYLVEPKRKGVFRASLLQNNVSEIAFVDIWPGFDYQFLVDYKEGLTYLIIDPKLRFIPAISLVNYTMKEISMGTGDYIKDICLQKDCLERISPFHRCRLAGAGRTVTFIELINEKPFGEGFDIRASLDKVNCPTGKLRECIIDKEWSISARYQSGKAYKFPFERIAEIPLIGLILNRIREALLNDRRVPIENRNKLATQKKREFIRRLQPNPLSRFNVTQNFYGFLRTITLTDIPILNISSPRISYDSPEDILYKLEHCKLISQTDKASPSAKIALNQGVYRPIQNTTISVLNTVDNEEANQILIDLREMINLIHEHLNLTISFIELKNETKFEELESSSVILHILKDKNSHRQFKDIEYQGLFNKHYHEKITIANLSSNNNKRKNHLMNVMLGLLCKGGGIPWIANLDLLAQKVKISIGWKVQQFKKPGLGETYYFCVFSIYNAVGELFELKVLTTTQRGYETAVIGYMENVIDRLITKFNVEQINFHRDGQYYPLKDKEIINNLITKYDTTVQLNFIAIYDGIIRLYDLELLDDPDRQFGNRISEGTTLKVMTDYYSMMTYSMGTRKSIEFKKDLRTEQTISIEFVSELEQKYHHDVLQNILDLTRCYHGYSLAKIKHPVTIHACRKILDIFYDNLPTLTSEFRFSSDREFFV